LTFPLENNRFASLYTTFSGCASAPWKSLSTLGATSNVIARNLSFRFGFGLDWDSCSKLDARRDRIFWPSIAVPFCEPASQQIVTANTSGVNIPLLG
jgi:hypothetical protein